MAIVTLPVISIIFYCIWYIFIAMLKFVLVSSFTAYIIAIFRVRVSVRVRVKVGYMVTVRVPPSE